MYLLFLNCHEAAYDIDERQYSCEHIDCRQYSCEHIDCRQYSCEHIDCDCVDCYQLLSGLTPLSSETSHWYICMLRFCRKQMVLYFLCLSARAGALVFKPGPGPSQAVLLISISFNIVQSNN